MGWRKPCACAWRCKLGLAGRGLSVDRRAGSAGCGGGPFRSGAARSFGRGPRRPYGKGGEAVKDYPPPRAGAVGRRSRTADRKSVVQGKRVSVRVAFGGGLTLNNK